MRSDKIVTSQKLPRIKYVKDHRFRFGKDGKCLNIFSTKRKKDKVIIPCSTLVLLDMQTYIEYFNKFNHLKD